jgi:prepilin peptidase CpaA
MSPISALIVLPFVAAICIWVAWSDMKFMKIPNKAVMALMAVYAAFGVIAVPTGMMMWQVWVWGIALAAIVLAIGFVTNAIGAVGAGDAKFAAAMAPFFVQGSLNFILALFAACLLAAFATHRIVKWTPALRRSVGANGKAGIARISPWASR